MMNKYNLLNHKQIILFIITVILSLVLSACSSTDGTKSEEESSVKLALNETYDQVRNGARLVLNYDVDDNSFNGFVANTTDSVLKQVRVEVHLSNGDELGPTIPSDLTPGESLEVSLPATNESFDWWSAHPEIGEGEHGHGVGEHEHRDEGDNEHSEGNTD